MLAYRGQLKSVELRHRGFAEASMVRSLKDDLKGAMHYFGATRGVLRVLTEKPAGDGCFKVEARAGTRAGELAVFGYNLPERPASDEAFHREISYLAEIFSAPRRQVRKDPEFMRIRAEPAPAEEVSALLNNTYSSHPIGLGPESVMEHLERSICFAALEDGRISSVLFGQVHDFGPLTAVEYTLSATVPSARGSGLTAALAARIRQEAHAMFDDPVMLAETIAGPVMRSCHDLGMRCTGALREHYDIRIGGRQFTNLFMWSL